MCWRFHHLLDHLVLCTPVAKLPDTVATSVRSNVLSDVTFTSIAVGHLKTFTQGPTSQVVGCHLSKIPTLKSSHVLYLLTVL